MYRIPITVHKRLMRGEIPIAYAVIQTHLGYRAYAEKELGAVFDLAGNLLDGSFLVDGSVTLGSASTGVIEKSARVLSLGAFERTIQPKRDDLLTSYGRKQKQHISLELDNADSHFSKLIAKEPFLGRPVSVYVGFEAETQATHMRRFSGTISELSVTKSLIIEADER